jgi:hypothetical protein
MRRQGARGRAFIHAVKARPCADCGIQYPPVVMDFDHVRGNKRFGLAKRVTASLATLAAEVEKCDVVCSNCHRLRTEYRRLTNGR